MTTFFGRQGGGGGVSQAAQDALIAANRLGNLLGGVNDFTDLAGLTPDAVNDWARVANEVEVGGGIIAPAGDYYWDGAAWQILSLAMEEYEHPSDVSWLSGTVDVDALLADVADGQAYHFQAGTTGASLTSTSTFGTVIDGDALGGVASPLAVPARTQGVLTRGSAGTVSVWYVNASVNFTTQTTGKFQIGLRHTATLAEQAIPGTVTTNHNFESMRGKGYRLDIFIRDAAADRGWDIYSTPVDTMLLNFDEGDAVDAYSHSHDNDFVVINVLDAVTGELSFTENGRDMEYVWSEVEGGVAKAESFFELTVPSQVVTTGAFQNLGDPDPRIEGSDGDTVFLEYGDTYRDALVFLDGIARGERKGNTASPLEVQLTAGGQLQVRDLDGASGISRAWYKVHSVRVAEVQIDSEPTTILRLVNTAQNVGGQPAGNGLMQLEAAGTVVRLTEGVTYESGVLSGIYPHELTVAADFFTVSNPNTGSAQHVYQWRDVLAGDPVGTIAPNSVAGVFGQGSAQQAATITIPANTAFSYDVRSLTSGNNQRVEVGASLAVTAMVSHEEAVTERLGDDDSYYAAEDLYANTAFRQTTAPRTYDFTAGGAPITGWATVLDNGGELADAGGTLTHTGGGANWDVGSTSSDTVASVEYVMTSPPTGTADGRFMFGLHDSQAIPASPGTFEFKYALYVVEGLLRVYEDGTLITAAETAVTHLAGDVLEVRVNVQDRAVEYVRNGAVFWTSAQAVSVTDGDIQDLHERVEVLEEADTATSGYQDIPGTSLRMQWGMLSVASLATLTFPVPFRDVPTVTANAALNGRIVSFNGTKTSTQWVFSVRNNNNAGSTSDVYWHAIGLKP